MSLSAQGVLCQTTMLVFTRRHYYFHMWVLVCGFTTQGLLCQTTGLAFVEGGRV